MPSSFGSNHHPSSSNASRPPSASIGWNRGGEASSGAVCALARKASQSGSSSRGGTPARVPAAVQPERDLRVGPLDRLVPAVVEDPDLARAVVPLGDRALRTSRTRAGDPRCARPSACRPCWSATPSAPPTTAARPRAPAAGRSAGAWPGACGSRTSCPRRPASPGAGSLVPSGPNSRLRTYSNRFGSFEASAISSEVFRGHGRRPRCGAAARSGPPRARRRAPPSRAVEVVERALAHARPQVAAPGRSRSHTLSIRKSCGSNPPRSTSSHVSGVETGARGSGRSEYAAAMFAPCRFMLWSMKTLPARSATRHAIVTRSGSARPIEPPARADEPADLAVGPAARLDGDVDLQPGRPARLRDSSVSPSWPSTTCTCRATASTSSYVYGGKGSRSKNR